MGFFDKLLGRDKQQQASAPGQYGQAPSGQYPPPPPGAAPGQYGQQAYQDPSQQGQPAASAATEDERAIARYKYLLRTSSPEQLEKVHAEAFAKLTPEQRQQMLTEMSRELPPGEAAKSAEPADLARAATRQEMRQPGYLAGAFGGGAAAGQQGQGQGMGGQQQGGMMGRGGGGMGMGKILLGSMAGGIAGMVVGSAISHAMFDHYDHSPEAQGIGDSSHNFSQSGYDTTDSGDQNWGGDDTQFAGDQYGGDSSGDYGYTNDTAAQSGYDDGGFGGYDDGGFDDGGFDGGFDI